jgi:hypothetical protein
MLLWQEYKAAHPDGCQYSAFCRDYDAWLGRQDAVMRFEHVPGEKLFVDYAGKTMAVVDRHTGEIQVAEVFVAALGAGLGLGSVINTPVLVAGRCWGTMNLLHEPDWYRLGDERVTTMLSYLVAPAFLTRCENRQE